MPRQKNPPPEELAQEQTLMLPVPVGSPHREHEHRVDPYRTLPGAMPQPSPIKKHAGGRPRKDDKDAQERAEAKLRLGRYDRFIDVLIAVGGDTDTALATMFNVTVQEAEARHGELLEEIQRDIRTSSMAEELERRQLALSVRLAVLRKWMLSNNPAASLKSVDMLQEIDGKGPRTGSYEHVLRSLT